MPVLSRCRHIHNTPLPYPSLGRGARHRGSRRWVRRPYTRMGSVATTGRDRYGLSPSKAVRDRARQNQSYIHSRCMSAAHHDRTGASPQRSRWAQVLHLSSYTARHSPRRLLVPSRDDGDPRSIAKRPLIFFGNITPLRLYGRKAFSN